MHVRACVCGCVGVFVCVYMFVHVCLHVCVCTFVLDSQVLRSCCFVCPSICILHAPMITVPSINCTLQQVGRVVGVMYLQAVSHCFISHFEPLAI